MTLDRHRRPDLLDRAVRADEERRPRDAHALHTVAFALDERPERIANLRVDVG